MLTKTIIENVLLLIGESFWLFAGSAQLHKLRKHRNTHGLSAPTATLNASANVAWMAYFASRSLWFPVVTNALNFFITVTLLAYILGDRKQFMKGVVSIVTIGPLTAYALVALPHWSGWIGMVYNWIASTPQLLHIVQTKKVSGLSPHSLMFTWGAMSCVFGYGLLVSAWPLVVGSIVGFVYEAIITHHYYHYRHLKH